MRGKMNFSGLIGKTMTKVEKVKNKWYGDMIIFVSKNGEKYAMFHDYDCSEDVFIEDICGDLSDLVGNPILRAEEASNNSHGDNNYHDSMTWTFYHLATIKGHVTIRWFGTSNGYYSEEVDFVKVAFPDDERLNDY